MAKHNQLGQAGEQAAVDFLVAKGYHILHRNWRVRHLELDIVASDGKEVAIIEVKTRSNTLFFQPEEAVNRLKIHRVVAAANCYVKYFQPTLPLRFDIISVVGDKPPFHIEHIQNAFYPPLTCVH